MDHNKRAVLVITRNSSHIFHHFINSYKRHCREDLYDLWLLDNKSRPGDIEYIETYISEGIFAGHVFEDANMLFTKSTNTLISRAKKKFDYDHYIIVNPDIEFRDGWDEHLDKNDGIMGFVLVKPDGTIEHAGGFGGGDHLGRGERDSPELFDTVREVDWVTFGAVAINRNVVNKIGFLDENFPHFGSDREYCRDALNAGFEVRCSPSRLTHGYGYSTRPYEWRDIPKDIWKQMIKERTSAGVYFYDDPKAVIEGV